jgi:uncharacterized protein (TIGR02001 family)
MLKGPLLFYVYSNQGVPGMKKLVLVSALAAAAVAPFGASAAEPTSPHTVTGNFAVVSDYRFRGISQSDEGPAIQGGIDYSHESGFYLGNWNSSISGDFINDAKGIEMDFYGGFKFPVGDFTFDIGALYYYYPGAELDDEKYNTLEAYVGAAYGPISGKIWYGIGDWFASEEADGSIYYELNGTFPLADKWSLVAHIGYQDVDGSSDFDYFDYKLGVAYDLNGWMLGAAVVGTDAEDGAYVVGNDDQGEPTIVFSVSKTF